MPVIFIFRDMGCHAVDRESAILDSIGVSTDYCAEVGVHCFSVDEVLGAVVIAQHDILGVAVLVIHKQICKTRTIGYERCIYSSCGNRVLLKRVRILSGSTQYGYRCS